MSCPMVVHSGSSGVETVDNRANPIIPRVFIIIIPFIFTSY